jgi:uncharacterized membrane protein
MAEQIAKDPAFNQMAQQLQRSVQNVGNDDVPQLDTNQYINAMQQVMQNPQFMTMAERLGNALMQVRLLSCSFNWSLHSVAMSFVESLENLLVSLARCSHYLLPNLQGI